MTTHEFPPELLHEFLIPKYPIHEDFIEDQNVQEKTLYDLLIHFIDTGFINPINGGIPSGGLATQILAKDTGADYDVSWVPAPVMGLAIADVPAGGFIDQILAKVSNTDYDLHWVNKPANGAPGVIGPQGQPGADGVAGPVGPTGPPGQQGIPGNQGIPGPTGPKGDKGDTGPIGPGGGDTGPEGPQGPIGPAGPTGPQGIPGPTGPTGNTGTVGPAGPQGDPGVQGPAGPQGLPGNTGTQGPQGPAGATGQAEGWFSGSADPAVGLANNGDWYLNVSTGDVFEKVSGAWVLRGSLKGPVGSQGPQGIPGTTGPAGTAGAQGIQGVQGPKGDTGAQGPKGDVGITPAEVYSTPQVLNGQAASYTFALSDAGKLVTSNNAALAIFTIPPNSTVPFPIGTYIDIFNSGAGLCNIAAGAGVFLAVSGASTNLRAQYSRASIQKVDVDAWSLFGDLAVA